MQQPEWGGKISPREPRVAPPRLGLSRSRRRRNLVANLGALFFSKPVGSLRGPCEEIRQELELGVPAGGGAPCRAKSGERDKCWPTDWQTIELR
jgi:hypothetical protein